ncbi:MAG: undecaprenyl-diphosphate phosphatase [Candidatus Babeliales bacterium]
MLLLLLFLSIILECFPISSSGNIILLTEFLSRYGYTFSKTMLTVIDYLSHGAIALTLAVYFFPRWFFIARHIRRTWPTVIKLCIAGFITELITVFFWLLFDTLLIPKQFLPYGFFITTCLLFSLRFVPQKKKAVSYSIYNAWLLGLVQGLALLPGISRFGSTFVAARWLGFSAQRAFELSFLISWPINCAAFLLGVYKVYQLQGTVLLNLPFLFIMLIGSSVAYFCFYYVEKIARAERLWLFAWYTAALVLVALFL